MILESAITDLHQSPVVGLRAHHRHNLLHGTSTNRQEIVQILVMNVDELPVDGENLISISPRSVLSIPTILHKRDECTKLAYEHEFRQGEEVKQYAQINNFYLCPTHKYISVS